MSIKELQAVGIANQPEFKATHTISKAAVYINGEQKISGPIPRIEGLVGYGKEISRKKLDFLVLNEAKKAGATVLENTLVTSYKVNARYVAVQVKTSDGDHEFNACLLIGADGANSIIARQMRRCGVPDANRVTVVRAYFEGVEGDSEQADLHFDHKSYPGYCWLFPTSQTEANVGVGVVFDKRLPESQDLLLKLLQEDEGLKSRLKNAKLKGEIEACELNTYKSDLKMTSDRVMLVGEAAGLVNPLNGEGIQSALISGRLAAETAIDCLRRKNFSE